MLSLDIRATVSAGEAEHDSAARQHTGHAVDSPSECAKEIDICVLLVCVDIDGPISVRIFKHHHVELSPCSRTLPPDPRPDFGNTLPCFHRSDGVSMEAPFPEPLLYLRVFHIDCSDELSFTNRSIRVYDTAKERTESVKIIVSDAIPVRRL